MCRYSVFKIPGAEIGFFFVVDLFGSLNLVKKTQFQDLAAMVKNRTCEVCLEAWSSRN